MSYEAGAGKYLLKALLYPGPYYVFGGVVMSLLDLTILILSGASPAGFLEYALGEYGFPSSIEQVALQLIIGAVTATGLWYLAVKEVTSPRARRWVIPR
jgi:hypothetical protein